MIRFVARRLLVSVGLLLGASFIVYQLVALSGDPLADLRDSSDPNRDALMAARSEILRLDVPAPLRYFLWLGGAAKCLVPFAGLCDLGVNLSNQPVTTLLPLAFTSTIQLLVGAVLLSIVLGIVVGVVSALRQNSALDYTLTFFVFVMFSLPSFFIAVLLKEFFAIGFNDFLQQPVISVPVLVVAGAVAGGVLQTIVAGSLRRRLLVAGVAAAAVIAVGLYTGLTGWFLTPSLGPVVVVLGTVCVGLVMALFTTDVRHRPTLLAIGASAVVVLAAFFLLQPAFDAWHGVAVVVGVVAITLVSGVAGALLGGENRRPVAVVGAVAGFAGSLLVVIDRFMAAWPLYMSNSVIRGRPIATIGASTPGFQGDFWQQGIDVFTHYLLPTTALLLVSMAAYTRYVRGGMLQAFREDYVRTARAKGLSEPIVVMRHAFRNALIPLATYIPVEIALVVGGTIIIEQVFGIPGMGQLFVRSLLSVDPNPVMAYFVVVATFVLIANLIADLSYAALDPRIRAAR